MMGRWTKQPGETSLYALIRRDAITVARLDQLATFASNRRGRTITRRQMRRWLRRYASFVESQNGTEFVLFEMPANLVDNLPNMFASQFVPLDQLQRGTPDEDSVGVERLNQLLGTEEGDL